jgi:hypothetical protein
MIIDQGDPTFKEAFDKLDLVRNGDWAILYRHRETGDLWDITFPHGEMHGGGPQRLRLLNHRDPSKWEPYQKNSKLPERR